MHSRYIPLPFCYFQSGNRRQILAQGSCRHAQIEPKGASTCKPDTALALIFTRRVTA